MTLTREEAIENHRKMWNWIADETELWQRKVYKEDYFEKNKIKNAPYLKCYCCEYNIRNNRLYCGENCIVNWENTDIIENTKDCTNSYYEDWCCEEDWQEAARLARIIANLPERKK